VDDSLLGRQVQKALRRLGLTPESYPHYFHMVCMSRWLNLICKRGRCHHYIPRRCSNSSIGFEARRHAEIILLASAGLVDFDVPGAATDRPGRRGVDSCIAGHAGRPGREPLSGKVEVDEIVIGGRLRGDHGSALGDNKSRIIAAVEVRGKGSGRVRLQPIPDKSAKSLETFVQLVVAPGTEVLTDGWVRYNQLGALGFRPLPTVLDGKGKQAAKAVLPRVHLIASLLKRWVLGTYHGRVSKKTPRIVSR